MAALRAASPLRPALVAIVTTLVLVLLAGALFSSERAISVLLVTAAVAIPIWLVVATARQRQRDEQKALASRALDSIPRPLFVVDAWRPGRPNVFVNDEYCSLTGYDHAEALAQGFDALGVLGDVPDGAETEAGSTGVRRQVRVRRRDGSTVVARLEVRALRGAAGFVGLLDPVEPSPSQADALRPLKEAAAPSSATVGITEAFLSWLTHELRSPLNACVMWLDVLALAPQPDKLTKAVDAIKRNLARQTKLVGDLNDAAKASGHGLELRLAPLDLVALLKRCIDTWQLTAIGKQLTFQHRIDPSSARVQGDSERLVQALNHLVDNAVNSTPSGGRVELRARLVDAMCVVEIEDSGGPLSTDDAAHLFEPLWRSAASSKSRAGLGLGLAVAHHIVAKHGGTLTVTSGDSGAVFTLMLPLGGPAAAEDPVAAQTSASS